MPTDIASLLVALVINMVTMAIALPAVMGQVSSPARRAQLSVVLQAAGWALLLSSNLLVAGSWQDRLASSVSMGCLAASLLLLSTAFDLWCGRVIQARVPAAMALLMTGGYAIGFASYPFRVGWANGLLAMQMLVMAVALARPPAVAVGRWRWVLVFSLLAQMVVTAWRGVIGGFYSESYPTFLAPHPINVVFVMVANATAVLSMVGILLAHRDEAARELERLATLDGLTGVFNRRAWLAQAAGELAVSLRYDRPLTVLLLDLDHFKRINDSLGHEAGDRALQFIARAMQAAVRAGDLVGRYGGEEFCVLMNHADAAAAHAFDRRLRARLDAAAEQELGFDLSYSAGIAMRAGAGDTLAAMIRRADATLYRAKAQGRSRTLDDQAALPQPA